MAKSINVIIDGRKFKLVGDDEELIRNSAIDVDNQILEFKSGQGDLSSSTISVLAALNIAEEKNKISREYKTDKHYIIDELAKMSDYLIKTIRIHNPPESDTLAEVQ